MSKSCIITGKKTRSGYNVSKSHRRTKRTLKPNLQKKRLLNPKTGRMITVMISTRGMRTLKKWDAAGKIYDLAQIKKQGSLSK